MKRLIAKRSVLYLGRMYAPGDTLPANDQKMVTAWLNAKSAVWAGQEAKEGEEQADVYTDNQEQENATEGAEEGQGTEMVEGNLDPDQLAIMKKDALEKLAVQLGVDISGAKNNKERAELIAAVPVQAPKSETGSAQ